LRGGGFNRQTEIYEQNDTKEINGIQNDQALVHSPADKVVAGSQF
jgi:hypothetical protein